MNHRTSPHRVGPTVASAVLGMLAMLAAGCGGTASPSAPERLDGSEGATGSKASGTGSASASTPAPLLASRDGGIDAAPETPDADQQDAASLRDAAPTADAGQEGASTPGEAGPDVPRDGGTAIDGEGGPQATHMDASAGDAGAGCTCLGRPFPVCTPTGHVTYTLAKAAAPTAAQATAYEAISCAMDGAMAYYDCYTNITHALSVSFDPSVATADGNINGAIRFGASDTMQCVTAMHEVMHTSGIGTASNWTSLVMNGIFTGANATGELRAITGNPNDVLSADTQHFWPYGLNYTTEATSTSVLVDHCKMVVAIRKDLGL